MKILWILIVIEITIIYLTFERNLNNQEVYVLNKPVQGGMKVKSNLFYLVNLLQLLNLKLTTTPSTINITNLALIRHVRVHCHKDLAI